MRISAFQILIITPSGSPERGIVFVGVCVFVCVFVCPSVDLEICLYSLNGSGVLNETLHVDTWLSSLKCDMCLETRYYGVS